MVGENACQPGKIPATLAHARARRFFGPGGRTHNPGAPISDPPIDPRDL